MDGTLVDSTDGVVGAWELFAEKYPGLDVTQVLSCKSPTPHVRDSLTALAQQHLMASGLWKT